MTGVSLGWAALAAVLVAGAGVLLTLSVTGLGRVRLVAQADEVLDGDSAAGESRGGVRSVVAASVGGLFGGGLWAWSTGMIAGSRLVLAMVAAIACAGIRGLVRQRQRERLSLETSARVQEVCALAAAELSAGLTTSRALHSCARTWPPMSAVVRASDMGASVPDALRQLGRRPGADDLVLMAAAWQVAHRTGAGLAIALSAVAESVRARAASARLVRSELSSARATARLMAVLPVMTLLMGKGMGGDPIRTLLATPLGLGCFLGGVVLMSAGLWWIEGIAGGIQRETQLGRALVER